MLIKKLWITAKQQKMRNSRDHLNKYWLRKGFWKINKFKLAYRPSRLADTEVKQHLNLWLKAFWTELNQREYVLKNLWAQINTTESNVFRNNVIRRSLLSQRFPNYVFDWLKEITELCAAASLDKHARGFFPGKHTFSRAFNWVFSD